MPPPDYTHVIALGINDLLLTSFAMSRYALGGADYQDPVAFDMVFQTDNVTGLPVATFAPMVEVRVLMYSSTFDCENCFTRRIIFSAVAPLFATRTARELWIMAPVRRGIPLGYRSLHCYW